MIRPLEYSASDAAILASAYFAHEANGGAVETAPHVGALLHSSAGRLSASLKAQMEMLSGAVTQHHAYLGGYSELVAGDGYFRRSRDVLAVNVSGKSFGQSMVMLFGVAPSTGTSEEVTQLQSANWCNRFLFFCEKGLISEALDSLFEFVEDALDVSDFHKLDCMLKQLSVERLSAEMLISVLRSTSRAKKALPIWSEMLNLARHKLEIERLPARLLRGM